jgi:hypothetical protein
MKIGYLWLGCVLLLTGCVHLIQPPLLANLQAQEQDQARAQTQIRARVQVEPRAQAKPQPLAQSEHEQPKAGEQQRLLDLYSRGHLAEIKPTAPKRGSRGSPGRAAGLTALLHRDRAAFRACYRTTRAPHAAHEAVRLEIELRTGRRRVRSVQITGTRNGRLERCLSRKIRRWRLPPRTPRTVSLLVVLAGS